MGVHFPTSSLDGIFFPSVPSNIKIWLERAFEEDEIRKALKECPGECDKVPGPKGIGFCASKKFSIAF